MADLVQTEAKKKSGGGGKCCLFGCLGVFVVGIIVVVVGFFAAKHMYGKLMDQYTETQAIELPSVDMSDARVEQVRQQWQAFQSTVEAGQAGRIELTDDEVNALIASDEDWQELKGRVYVKFTEGEVQGTVSIPLEELAPAAKGRYLNGEGTFNVSCTDGRMKIYIKSLQLGQKEVPDVMMNELRKQDLAQEIYNDPSSQETVDQISRIKQLEFQPGKMVLEISAKPGE